jgi:hypothetical protein
LAPETFGFILLLLYSRFTVRAAGYEAAKDYVVRVGRDRVNYLVFCSRKLENIILRPEREPSGITLFSFLYPDDDSTGFF